MFLLDIVSVSPIEIAADMLSFILPVALSAAAIVAAAVFIIKAVKKKK